jgi:recombination protein RecR
MNRIPEPIQRVIAAFDRLPGIGPRAASRFTYFLISQSKEQIEQFARALLGLAEHVRVCEICHQWSDMNPCMICGDAKRQRGPICVVAQSPDIQHVEDTGVFQGVYHVLGGTIDAIEGRTPEVLNIKSLLNRLEQNPVEEVILALDTNVSGDTTAMYLQKELARFPIRVSRLARGLPTGAALEYADPNTLAEALKNRKA